MRVKAKIKNFDLKYGIESVLFLKIKKAFKIENITKFRRILSSQ